MSRYPRNPLTGKVERPPFEGLPTAVFEFFAVIVGGFIVITMVAVVIYICIALWTLMLT